MTALPDDSIDAEFRRYKLSKKYTIQDLILVGLVVGIVVYFITRAFGVW